MKLLIASVCFAAALIVAATAVPHSRSLQHTRAAGMGSLQDLHRATDTSRLPVEEFEDMSLVYSAKR
jgi:hypothetical protein